jgi:hypothetical protein
MAWLIVIMLACGITATLIGQHRGLGAGWTFAVGLFAGLVGVAIVALVPNQRGNTAVQALPGSPRAKFAQRREEQAHEQ